MTPSAIPLLTEADVEQATRQVRDVATRFGFSLLDANLIAATSSELATNVLLHAGNGMLYLAPTDNGCGLEIRFVDDGPGIADIEQACVKGYSSRPDGLGLGLAAARHAMDEFEIASEPGRGTAITIRHYRAPPTDRFDIGTATSADPAYDCNGDVVFARGVAGDRYLLGVIDGMGQGEEARAVALCARSALEQSRSTSLPVLAREAHEAVRNGASDRGFAMALLLASQAELRLVTVGDVACRLFHAQDGTERQHFAERPGILGTMQPVRFVEQRLALGDGDLPLVVLLLSDGISPRFSSAGHAITATALDLAQELMRTCRRAHGDATAAIMRIQR